MPVETLDNGRKLRLAHPKVSLNRVYEKASEIYSMTFLGRVCRGEALHAEVRWASQRIELHHAVSLGSALRSYRYLLESTKA